MSGHICGINFLHWNLKGTKKGKKNKKGKIAILFALFVLFAFFASTSACAANHDVENVSRHQIKLVVSGAQMRAYVNSESQPTLAVPRLEGNVTNGRIAFEGEAIIANLVIKPNAVEGLSPLAGIDPTDNDPRYLRHWQLSQPAVIPKGIDRGFPQRETN